MKIAIIGTGVVGQSLAAKLVTLGHEVSMGTRNVTEKSASTVKDSYGNPSFSEWHKLNSKVKLLTFADAAALGEIVINATHGNNSLDALKMAGERNLEKKVLIDISNPLEFTKGTAPTLIPELSNKNSLGEAIQKAFPGTMVVKTLNTMWCGLMINPGLVGNGDHINYVCGNNEGAKAKVKKLLTQFGWRDENILDLGDITAARATEGILPIWIKIMGIIQTGAFNFKLVR